MEHTLRVLFRTRPVRSEDNRVVGVGNCPLFTLKGLKEAVFSMKNKEESGPNYFPAVVYKLVFRHRADLLLGVFNACMKDNILPSLKNGETCSDSGLSIILYSPQGRERARKVHNE